MVTNGRMANFKILEVFWDRIKGDFSIIVLNINGRPTRKFVFKLTFANLALRVFKPDRGKQVVSWMDQVKP